MSSNLDARLARLEAAEKRLTGLIAGTVEAATDAEALAAVDACCAEIRLCFDIKNAKASKVFREAAQARGLA